MRSAPFVVAAVLLACGGGDGSVCTTASDRSTITCTPTTPGCVGRDLGYDDDKTYGASCEAPRHDDTSSCATLYRCDTTGPTPQWKPVAGF